MAISTSDISALPDYADSDLKKLYRWALANGAAGTTRSINGRSVTFPSVTDILKVLAWAESDVESNGGNIALAQFREAQ